MPKGSVPSTQLRREQAFGIAVSPTLIPFGMAELLKSGINVRYSLQP